MIVFIAFSVAHVCFFVWLYYHWWHIAPTGGVPAGSYTFSIIVPVRNEAVNIRELLRDIVNQDYPLSSFELIIVDDHSEDGTLDICRNFLRDSSVNYQLIQLDKKEGKKAAISAAVERASHEIILTTDGDCRLGRGWISGYAVAYEKKDAMMVTGPVRMDGSNTFERIQSYEFSALIGVGAASLQSGNPGMCNGANLSYKKELFVEVNGYDGNGHIPSGDDEFLLQKAFSKYPHKVFFLKNDKSVVTTRARKTLGELANQRVRWSSKWKFHKSKFIKFTAVILFFDFVVMAGAFVYGFTSPEGALTFWPVFMIRWLSVYLLAHSVSRFLNLKTLFFPSLAGEIIYPFFVIFLGLASIFGKYSWKGRQYK